MTFSIGENICPYRILEQFGQGGMATVYKAYPETKLVMAKIYINLNDVTNAKRLLNAMTTNADLPTWILEETRNLLNTLPK